MPDRITDLNKMVIAGFHYNRHSAEFFSRSMKECGAVKIELCPYASWLDITDRDDTERFAALLRRYGLRTETLVPEYGGVVPFNIGLEHPDAGKWSLLYAKKMMDNMSVLGVRKLVIGAGRQSADLPAEEGWERSRKNLRELGSYAAERGICILLCSDGGNSFSNIVRTTDEQLRMLNEVGLSNVRAYMDNVSIAAAGERFEESLSKLSSSGKQEGMIGHICISDGPEGWMLPGEGSLGEEAVKNALEMAYESGYQGGFSCRLCHWKYDFTPDQYTKKLKAFWDNQQ